MHKFNYQLFCITLLYLINNVTFALSTEDLDILGSYGSEEMVSIASGYQQPIVKAAGIANVITAKDIKLMGARLLSEILETVPGLHVTASSNYAPLFVIRGIYSEFNPQILFLENGVPITNFFFGNRGQVWGGMQVENISRIEILRSPGSAIYGADAVAGVVNIITKSADDINSTKVGGRIGSFNEKKAWVLHGANYAGWKTAFSLQLQSTNGHKETIEADAQTKFDNSLGTSASLAPGPANNNHEIIDASIEIAKDNWRGHINYQGRHDLGVGAGASQALDPVGKAKDDRFLIDVTYRNTDFSPDWDFSSTLSYLDVRNKSTLVLFPAGADFSGLGGGAFPDGVRGDPGVAEHHWRFESTGLFTGFNEHAIRLGLGLHYGDMYEITETKNYSLTPSSIPVPLGGMTDVSDTAAFVKETDRKIYFTYIQDEWKFAPDWAFTTGLRFDDYSDFGSTLNPRLALVWQSSYNLTSKLLYNRAFRPPSFAEQFNINNPVAVGNPDLNPETIDTVELAFNYRATNQLTTDLTLFHYDLQDIIRFVADPAPLTSKTAQNSRRQTAHGLEWEIKWNPMHSLDVIANYAYQKSKDHNTNTTPGIAPEQQVYIRGNWRFLPKWSLTPQLNHVHNRSRQEGDNRPAIDDYTVVDLTLRRISIRSGFEYAISIHNLFDADAREPSPSPGLIPNDLPLAGRNLFAEVRYSW